MLSLDAHCGPPIVNNRSDVRNRLRFPGDPQFENGNSLGPRAALAAYQVLSPLRQALYTAYLSETNICYTLYEVTRVNRRNVWEWGEGILHDCPQSGARGARVRVTLLPLLILVSTGATGDARTP